MHELKIEKFNFEWDELDKNINQLGFSKYIGNSEEYIFVKLPSFVSFYNSKQKILFPKKFIEPHQYDEFVTDYMKCNWLGAANYLCTMKHEKSSIIKNILSIADMKHEKEFYHFALVNRYILFIRDFAAYKFKKKHLIGKINKPKILLTHDVDANKVTFGLKLRQFFHNQKWPKLPLGEDLNCIEEIVKIENKFNTKSIFFFNASKRYFSIPLVDPSYKISELIQSIQFLKENGIKYGLHPGILSSIFEKALRSEINNFRYVTKEYPTLVRNHWLSNFKERTWKIQENLNVKIDYSTGFNNIPGFRNLSLIEYTPYEKLKLIPMIIMDGQFHNYIKEDKENIMHQITPIIDELVNVGGIASINFHQRFFHSYYGYKSLYEDLLQYLNEKDLL